MRHRFRKYRVALILVCSSAVLLVSCQDTRVVVAKGPGYETKSSSPPAGKGPPPWAPAHGYRAKHKYRYYPSSRVYYDTGRGVYFYYSNGDWQIGVSLPDSIHIDSDEYVTLEMDSDKPYEYHSAVKNKYPPGQAKKYKQHKWK